MKFLTFAFGLVFILPYKIILTNPKRTTNIQQKTIKTKKSFFYKTTKSGIFCRFVKKIVILCKNLINRKGMSEQTQNERLQKDMAELDRCIEMAKKDWPNGRKDYEEWYKLFRCE